MNPVIAATLAAMLLLPGAALAGDETYYFGANETMTNISFEAKTSLGSMMGRGNIMSGSATGDIDLGTGSTEIKVPVKSLRTGFEGRDTIMCSERWLDAAKYPDITFKSTKVTKTDAGNWTVEGDFTLHGVTKNISLPVAVKRIPEKLAAKLGPGKWVRVKTAFIISIKDYGMETHTNVISTIYPEWSVSVDLKGTTEKPAGAAAPKDKKVEIEIPKDKDWVRIDPDVKGTRYVFNIKPQMTNVSAESKNDLETIVATTTTMYGELAVDFEKGEGLVKLSLPVAALKTGIDLLDEHLRGPEWMDAAQFPFIRYEASKFTRKDEKNWTVEGNFTMHGVTKPVTAEVEMRKITAEKMREAKWWVKDGIGFTTKFTLKLSDFGIAIPAKGAGKVEDTWTIKFDAVAGAR